MGVTTLILGEGIERELETRTTDAGLGEMTEYRVRAGGGAWTPWLSTITAAVAEARRIDVLMAELGAQRYNDEQIRRSRQSIRVHPDSTDQL